MFFHQLTFFVFFPFAVVAALAPAPWRLRKFSLLVLSYFVLFYDAWQPLFVVLLVAVTCIDWLLGRRIGAATTKPRRRIWLMCSIALDIGLLSYFKIATPSIGLPLGISFYTFQSLSYTIDVYRGRSACGSLLDYALYLAFFPRLGAGPMVRANQFLPQCEAPRSIDLDTFCSGLALLVLGVCGKLVLADRVLDPVVSRTFAGALEGGVGIVDLWIAILSYPCEIFFDFAGYSMAAIGIARCLGFELPRNFNFPFAAHNVTEFWRRWHISLSSWIKDYTYLPLNLWVANRTHRLPPGRIRRVMRPGGSFLALVLTMGLMGLWHGAMWSMLLYGATHGVVLGIEMIWLRRRGAKPAAADVGPKVGAIAATYLFVAFTGVLFRMPDVGDALKIWRSAVSAASTFSTDDNLIPGFVLAALVPVVTVAIHVLGRRRGFESGWSRIPAWGRGLMLGVMLVLMSLYHGEGSGFIYAGF